MKFHTWGAATGLSNFVIMHGWMDDHYVASGWGNVGITEDTGPMTNHSNEAVSPSEFLERRRHTTFQHGRHTGTPG